MLKRGFLTLLVSAALLGAAAIVAAVWYYPRLPDPEHANHRELIRWLVSGDLERVPETTREVLARRLEEEFSGEVDWHATAQELTDSQRRRLCENVTRLVGPWIRHKARCYASLSPAEQPEFLDQLIDTIEQWRGLDELLPPSGASDGGSPGLMVSALEQLAALKRQEPSAEQGPMSEFVRALQTRWAVRELSQHLERAGKHWFSGH